MNAFKKLMICTVAVVSLVAPAMAGPVWNSKYDVHHVAAYSIDMFYVTFRGYENAAVIIISGDGDTDPDLFGRLGEG